MYSDFCVFFLFLFLQLSAPITQSQDANSQFSKATMKTDLSTNQLKRQLRRLGRSQRQAARNLRTAKSSGDSFHPKYLPKNDRLEKAMALSIFHNRDARSMLEYTKSLMNATLLSLAFCPSARWDPYDVKPQVFALDTYIGLPVFTSYEHLRHFCRKFEFTVRDPSGHLWVDPQERDDSVKLLPTFEGWSTHRTSNQSQASDDTHSADLSSESLFDMMTTEAPVPASSADENKEKEKKSARLRKKAKLPSPDDDADDSIDLPFPPNISEADFWEKVNAVKTFEIKKATPLAMFGPFTRPFFVGYFADVETLLCNASIVPEKVDIVLNPCSPIEMALAREATDLILHRDSFMLKAYQELEKAIRSELYTLLARFCPEVTFASSACVPRSNNSQLYKNYIEYDVVVLLRTEDFPTTWESLRRFKREGKLKGHSSVEILTEDAASPFVREAATPFYSGEKQHQEKGRAPRDGDMSSGASMGCFVKKGPISTVNVGVDADSYFHDASNIYTESHAVFTEQQLHKRASR